MNNPNPRVLLAGIGRVLFCALAGALVCSVLLVFLEGFRWIDRTSESGGLVHNLVWLSLLVLNQMFLTPWGAIGALLGTGVAWLTLSVRLRPVATIQSGGSSANPRLFMMPKIRWMKPNSDLPVMKSTLPADERLPARDTRLSAQNVVAATSAVWPRNLLSHILLGVILGALAGSVVSVMRNPTLVVSGNEIADSGSSFILEWIYATCSRTVLSVWGILGAIVGGAWARDRFLNRRAVATTGVPRRDLLAARINLSARSCFALTAGSWLLGILMWGWLLSRPPGALEDQAGMIITFVVLPLTLALWVVGGPAALALAKQVRERTRSRKDGDQRLARAGIALSRLMLWGGVGVLLWRINW